MLYINDDIYGFDLDEALLALPEWRRGQALRYRHERDRRLSAAAYRLLCHGLSVEYGMDKAPEFGWHDGGKPFIVGCPEVHFNLSHCPAAALCVVSRCPVGADIEMLREYNCSLARRVLNDDELRQVEESARPDVEFARLWTMKESLLKLTGEGIRRDLKSVLCGDGVRFTTAVCLNRGYVYTVCEGG